MSFRKIANVFGFVVLAFGMVALTGCGGSSTPTTTAAVTPTTTTTNDTSTAAGTTSTSDSYKVYSVTSTAKFKGKEQDMVVVLPSTAAAPTNSAAVANAAVTFTQSTASSSTDTSQAESITVTADASGQFTIPDSVQSASQSEDNQPECVVSDPAGNAASISTTLPVGAEDDGTESPLSLKIVPSEFKMLSGEFRVFHALKVLPNGKLVKAKNVTWNCDAAGNGILTMKEEGANKEFVVCQSGANAGSVQVSGSVSAGGGLTDTAKGEVISTQNLIKVQGTVKKDGTAVGKGFMMNFDLPPVNGLKAFHFAGPTNENGQYTVFLPAVPADQAQTEYHTLIGTPMPDAKLHRADPKTFTVALADNGTILTGKDFTIGDAFVPLPPPLPVAKIIRGAWDQVNSAIRPRFFEPFHGVRALFLAAAADGNGQVNHRGMFNHWCYEKSGKTVTLTPPAFSTTAPPSCPNANAHEKIVVTQLTFTAKQSASWDWTKYLKPKDPTTGTQAADFKKMAHGTVNDTITCDTSSVKCYISKIEAVTHHYPPDNETKPFNTTLWTWTRTLGTSEEVSDELEPATISMSEFVCSGDNKWSGTDFKTACGTGAPFGSYSVTREKTTQTIDWQAAMDNPQLLFNFYGSSSHYFKEPDGSIKELGNAMCSSASPCTFYTDGSGAAKVDSNDGKVKVSFTLKSFKSDVAAEGTLTLTVKDLDGTEKTKEFKFTIEKFGSITITNPDGTTIKFPIFV